MTGLKLEHAFGLGVFLTFVPRGTASTEAPLPSDGATVDIESGSSLPDLAPDVL